MPISAAEMQRISKEKTSQELQKLHKNILQNNDLLKGRSEWHESDFTESTASDDESEDEPKIKRLTLAEMFRLNQHLHKELRQMVAKCEKTKHNHMLIEKKYEQLRIENSEQYLEVCELNIQCSKLKRFVFASAVALASLLVRCLW